MFKSITGWAVFGFALLLLYLPYDWLQRHPQHNPFAPFSLSHPPGWATQQKLAGLRDPDACFAVLEAAGVAFQKLPVIGSGSCLADQRTDISRWPTQPDAALLRGVAPTCAVGAGLLLWQRDVVQPMAMRHLGRRVERIEHYGSYSCRNIRGGNSPSEHSTGNAIDISAFVLSDGRRVTLLDHWDSPDGRSAFLRSVRDGGCTYFATVLSPDYNAAHRDHFHFDQAQRAGGWGVCR
jgi:hypothetical protein